MRQVILLLLCSVTFNSFADKGCNYSVSSVNFGTYIPLSFSHDVSSGMIQIRCSDFSDLSAQQPVEIKLSTGLSGQYATRTLRNNNNFLAYNLFLDPAYTNVWGDGNLGTGEYRQMIAKNQLTTMNIYGKIIARQDVRVGSYSDTINITVDF
jgi:spore coat protein U-like protein